MFHRELIERVNATAGALAARGIGVGDVVGLLAPNSSLFAVAFHGILRSGATATTINALFTAHDIVKQLTDANATMLITVSALLPQAQEAARTVGITPENLIVLDGDGAAATGHPNADDLLAPGAPAPQLDLDPATHLAVLPYSSGTTGNPKGVMLTHQNLVANMAQLRPLLAMRPDDKILAVLPFFHIYGMTVLLNAALQARAALVVMPRFDLTAFLDTIQEHRVTYGFIAPPVAVALAKHPLVDRYDMSSLRVILSGAAPLDAELGTAVAERLTVRVLQGFGMSELSPVSHCMPADGGQEHFGEVAPLNSCGWPVPNTINKIVDPASVAAAAAATGDVTVLVNNAGSSTGADLLAADLDDIRLEMDTHYFGTLSVARAFAPQIAAGGGGAILNVLSGLSWVSFPQFGAYCAAKSAQWSLTNALRLQLADQGIRVAGLHVGYMDTDMVRAVDAAKSDPADIARIAVDGIAAGAYEILADDAARQAQAALAGGVSALYPQLP